MNNIEETIQIINDKVKSFIFLDVKIHSYSGGQLILGLGQDLMYGHILEIHFQNVFTIMCNMQWSLDAKNGMIGLVNQGASEIVAINKKYGVEIGNYVFQLLTDEDKVFYIVAEEIFFYERSAKYY
jgi:hypothetical protein